MREHPPRIPVSSSPNEPTRPQLSYADFILDLDKFDGQSDADILAHLKRIALLATDGQLMDACGIAPNDPRYRERKDLMNLYVSRTIETIRRLRS